MSSIVGHALIGAAIGDNSKVTNNHEKFILCAFYALLSICPDFDYLPTWMLGFHMEPRYSHSIGGCLIIFAFGYFAKKYFFSRLLRNANVLLIFIAPLSHLILDFLVGVHKNPDLWPLSSDLYAAGHGILPSAGRLSIDNFYLWRNLTIELGILIPVAVVIAASGRVIIRKNKLVLLSAIVSILFFGCISYGLQR